MSVIALLNVLSIVHFSAFGGPHNRTAQVATALAAYGVNTIIAIPSERGSAYGRLSDLGLDVHRVPIQRLRRTMSITTQLATLKQAKPGINALRELIRDHHIDVVCLNALNAPQLALAPRLEHVPIVWELIDTFPNRFVRSTFMPFVRRWSDAIMSTGRAVATFHRGATRLGDRLVYFYPCVDTSRFLRTPGGVRAARAALRIQDDAMVIGTVGNLNPMKGHRHFIRAATLVKAEMPLAKFVILGASYTQYPGYWEGVTQLAESLGLRMGHDLIVRDPGTKVAELAQAFDVFWMTSEPRSEGIPTAIGEALSLEIPVVAFDVGAISEAVTSGVTGFVVPQSKPEAMVAPTTRLLMDPRLRQSMGKCGRAAAQRTFATEIGALRHLYAYECAIDHHNRVRPQRERR